MSMMSSKIKILSTFNDCMLCYFILEFNFISVKQNFDRDGCLAQGFYILNSYYEVHQKIREKHSIRNSMHQSF